MEDVKFILQSPSEDEGNMKDEPKILNVKEMSYDKPEQQNENSSSIIREEPVDLLAIDKNNDEKVYKDMMDWNVISDEQGECPLCVVTLEEVSIDEAKKNLIENDFI